MASTFTDSGSITCTAATYTCDTSSFPIVTITGIDSIAELTISVKGAIAPKSNPSDYTRVTSYDSGKKDIDGYYNTIIFSTECTLPCRTCSSGDPT